MRSVNFDNPWLLLLAIPLLMAVIIPFVIAIRKENRQKSVVISFVIHLVVILLVTLAAAGTMITTILTETEVYVVADVSYSSERELDLIDGYIKEIEDNLPRKTKLGVLCFANGYEILYEPGEDRRSVKESLVDKSATDIVSAIDYASDLFKDDVVKKMVLITDGKSTDTNSRGKLVSAMESLNQKKISLDAIFVNSTISDSEKEIQISDVENVNKTYVGVEATAKVLIQSNYGGKAVVTLYVKGEGDTEFTEMPFTVETITPGYNMITVPLLTDTAGVNEYRVTVSGENDICDVNNAFEFTQEVDSSLDVLLVTELQSDIDSLSEIYKNNATLTSVLVKQGKPVIGLPYTVEELSKYDEIILSNIDIRSLPNVTSFLEAVELVVSQYGKNLTTMGNLYIQNKDDELLGSLGDMLPINYGNSSADPKMYTLVLDTSHSMNQAFRFRATKDAAKSLLSLLSDDDMVCIVAFSQDSTVLQPPVRLGDKRTTLNTMIEELEPSQGTFLGNALSEAYKNIKGFQTSESQVMLISDGKTSDLDKNPIEIAKMMKASKIVVSTINVASSDETPKTLLENIASVTGGQSYFLSSPEDATSFIFAEVADDVTDAIITEESAVHIKDFKDLLLLGGKTELDDIKDIPNVFGYVQTKEKSDAILVLSVDYAKDSATVQVPLYSWREYGNGKVATLTTSPSGDWIKGWDDGFKSLIFGNMLSANMPSEKIDYPYTVQTNYDGAYIKIEVTPSKLRADGAAYLTVTLPNGETFKLNLGEEDEKAVKDEKMIFDSQKYYYEIALKDCIAQLKEGGVDSLIGRYEFDVVYSYGENKYVPATENEPSSGGISSKSYFNISWEPEYDMFASYSPSILHAFVEGEIKNGEAIIIKSNRDDLATYEYRFTVLFLILAAILYTADIGIRILRVKKKSAIKDKGGAYKKTQAQAKKMLKEQAKLEKAARKASKAEKIEEGAK